uniref:NADH-ubiquinone oxidoreductase chain 6 n=1 Tax=Omosita colon TaxID=878176 RepID=A0A7H1DJN0_9CUCU|nr:NADH dehydrogenase subunit 6 [Omosita colon]QNS37172.1 NADH dehydrogenase subunit 6 [Omosita colon]QVG61296.1 NADH dehydrogenase subunit 6 [Omosita colon]
MMNFLILMSWSMSFIFLFLNHPLSFGFILLMQTIAISLISGFMNYNYWFSYILFLVMIGGMLILFIYMTSIASNEKFKFSFKLFISLISMILIMIIIMMIDQYFFNNLNINNDMYNFNMNINNTFSLNKFMNYPNYSMLFMIFIYLYITLIAVTKISNINKGPLRQKF